MFDYGIGSRKDGHWDVDLMTNLFGSGSTIW